MKFGGRQSGRKVGPSTSVSLPASHQHGKMPVMVKLLSFPKVRFQYRLKTLFVLVVVVAVPCCWLTWTMEAKRRERANVAAIKELGGVCMDCENPQDYEPPGPAWLRSLLGDDFFANVVRVNLFDSRDTDAAMTHVKDLTSLTILFLPRSQISDEGLSNVQGLSALRQLYLEGTQVSDNGLKHLEKLTRLEVLFLEGTQVTDLKHLAGLTRLETLFLDHTQINDSDLKHLEKLTRLECLSLNGTQVTDPGLEHLRSLKGLRSLWLHGCQVTDTGLGNLQRALPDCDIRLSPSKSYSLPDSTLRGLD